MKKLLASPIVKNLLASCMILSLWVSNTHACILFFGEYPYPREEDYIS